MINTDTPLSPEELKKMYDENNFGSHTPEQILNDTKYNMNALKSAPFFGEETLGIYPKIYQKLADMGYSPALYELGLLYYNGEWWFKKDLKKSLECHTKAAEMGNANAMFELYVLYSTGDGVKKDNMVAVEWCKKAADLGQNRACYNMGGFYAVGNGIPKDLDLSVKWYDKASKAGNGKASATLGVMYKMGEEIPKDDAKAEEYFKTAELQLFDLKGFLKMFGVKRK
jgi:TPR repeat protein